jgi:hypothetical protein
MGILKVGDWIVIGAVGLTTVMMAIPDGGSTPAVAAFIDSAAGSDGPWPLTSPRTIEYTGPLGVTVVEIGPSAARILSSPCRHQICVNSGWIQHTGEVAVCLPNRLILRLVGDGGSTPDLDAVTQ